MRKINFLRDFLLFLPNRRVFHKQNKNLTKKFVKIKNNAFLPLHLTKTVLL